MSRPSTNSLPVVEWSPGKVRAFSPSLGESASLGGAFATVRAALSRRNTFVRAIRIPNVSASEAERILRLQIPQNFPLAADDLVFTYRLTSDVSPEGKLVVVAAARAAVVRSLHADLKEQGASVAEVVPAAFGSMILARALNLPDVAVVEPGPEGWSIDIIAGGELRYSRVLPPETDPNELESEVCRTYGMAGLPCCPMLAAGKAKLPFADVHTERSNLEALTGPEIAALKVTLELPEIIAAREKRIVGNRARLATLLAVSALALGAVVGLDRMDAAAEVQKVAAQERAGLTKIRRARDAARAKQSATAKIEATLDRAFQPAQKHSEVTALVSSLAPRSIWLTGMTLERGRPMTVRGVAMQSTDVAAYLELLTAQPRFRDVKLVFANDATIEETKVSQFSLSLHVVGNLPLADPKGTKKVAAR